MYVDFESLPDTARVWVYQANRPFKAEEIEAVTKALEHFIDQWTAHGKELKASYELRYNRFIILALDQQHSAASGCSIDASVHFIQSLQEKYGLDLLDKMNVTYKQGEYIAYKPLNEFKKMAKDKAISGKTVVFNNLVNNKQEYLEHWEVPASESWHSRFL